MIYYWYVWRELCLDTKRGKYDVSNHRYLKDCVIVYERPLTDYVEISEDKISTGYARRCTSDKILNNFLKDARNYEDTPEGEAKLQHAINHFREHGGMETWL